MKIGMNVVVTRVGRQREGRSRSKVRAMGERETRDKGARRDGQNRELSALSSCAHSSNPAPPGLIYRPQ
jgi:hypothetical protein